MDLRPTSASEQGSRREPIQLASIIRILVIVEVPGRVRASTGRPPPPPPPLCWSTSWGLLVGLASGAVSCPLLAHVTNISRDTATFSLPGPGSSRDDVESVNLPRSQPDVSASTPSIAKPKAFTAYNDPN